MWDKKQTDSQPFAKLKEVQANTQSQRIAPHLILPYAPSPPTTHTEQKGCDFCYRLTIERNKNRYFCKII
jgi:hypothetical protein